MIAGIEKLIGPAVYGFIGLIDLVEEKDGSVAEAMEDSEKAS